jgi:hydrocephalus-inducing protein
VYVSIKRMLHGVPAGDLSFRYSWDVRGLGKHFTMSPASGFLPAGQEAAISITFKPKHASSDIQVASLPCKVDGLAAPLCVSLSGAAVKNDDVTGHIKFDCPVRQQVSQVVKLANPTRTEWRLQPAVQSGPWVCPEHIAVPANGSADCRITYQPLSMAAPESPHNGSVFVALPDGSAALYRLEGVASAPHKGSCPSLMPCI